MHRSWLETRLVLVDRSSLRKMISYLIRKDLLGSLHLTGCGRTGASQIKRLSCMFTSIFGDVSMTIQSETLLKGEGLRCPFTQERGRVIHQPGWPFHTLRPSLYDHSSSTHPSPHFQPPPPLCLCITYLFRTRGTISKHGCEYEYTIHSLEHYLLIKHTHLCDGQGWSRFF